MRRFLILLVLLLVTVGTVSAADPVSYYKLDEGFTDSAGSNDGTNSGVTFDVGYWNQSGYFDGSSYFSANTISSTDFTHAAWIYPDTTSQSSTTIVRDGENHVYMSYDSGKIKLRYKNIIWQVYSISSTTIPADQWTHVAITYNDAEGIITLYINGQYDSEYAITFSDGGAIDTMVGTSYEGMIDEVKIYDDDLSALGVQDLYQNSIHNSFILSAYDELNQTQLTIDSFTIYNENQTVSTGTLIDTNYFIYSNQFSDRGQYIISIDVDGYYSRNFIVDNQYTPNFVSTYIPPETETVIYERFTLNDNVGLYDTSDIILRLDKPMGDDTNTIYSSCFDMNSQASTYLIPNDAYVLYIITPTETISYGWLYPDADGSVTINYNQFEFDEIEEWLDYTYECTDTSVSFDYTASKTVESSSFVVSYDNGTEAYNVSAATDTGSFTYVFPGNATYKIDINVETDDDNTFTMQKFIEIGKTNQRDFFPESFTMLLKSIVVMFGVVIGVLALSSHRADLSAMWAFGLYAFAVYHDWIYGNVITVSILGIITLAAIKKFQKRESRM